MIEQLIESTVRRNFLYQILSESIWLLLIAGVWVLEILGVVQLPMFPYLFPLSLGLFLLFTARIVNVIRKDRNRSSLDASRYIEKSTNFDELYNAVSGELHSPIANVSSIYIRGNFGEENGQMIVTKSFIIILSRNELSIIRLSDVIWIYTRNYVTARGSGTTLYIAVRSGERISGRAKYMDKQVDSAIQLIHEHFPWIIIGPNNDVKINWSKNRQSVIDEVDKHRNQALQAESM